MCEGSFLPSSFGPHQKHTEFESSLRSYPISATVGFNKGLSLPDKPRLGHPIGAPLRNSSVHSLALVRLNQENRDCCEEPHGQYTPIEPLDSHQVVSSDPTRDL